MQKLTALQEKVYLFICKYAEESGFPPSYADIARHFHFSSDGTVRTYLEHLEKKGYIQRLGQARGIKLLKKPVMASIPIVGKIAAGAPILAVEEAVGFLSELPELTYREGRFALRVSGDSMKDAGILNGDLAIIQTGVPVSNGQIAAIRVEGEATLKRIYFEKAKVRLQPENEFYSPIYVDRDQFDVQVIGRYVGLVRTV